VIRPILRAGLILALLFSPPLSAATGPVGKVIAVSGEASVIRSRDNSHHTLAFKDPVFLNDRIVTAAAGQVKLLLNDDSVLKVSPTSELHITEQVIGPGEESRTTINLLKGKLRSIIGKQLGGNSRFEVHTDVAVAGVRGTDFEVLAEGETLIRCFSGRVAVGNIDPNLPQQVFLQADMFSRVLKEQAPTPPAFIAPGDSLRGKLSRSGFEEGGNENEGGQDDSLVVEELERLGSKVGGAAVMDLPPLPDVPLSQNQSAVFFEEVLQEVIYGDPAKGQIDIVVEPSPSAIAAPLNITIPTP
jgi:hypothetical protein